MEASEELEAIQAVLEGNPEAFGVIVVNYQNLVGSVAYRLGVRRDEIEDMVSEVFVKVYRNLSTYRPEFTLSTWIYRIATNHVLDHLRRRRKEAGQVEMPVTVADPGPQPAENVAAIERAEMVRAALSELPEKYRAPLVLMHIEGLGVSEISRILSLPAGTIKTRLARGRTRLGRILRQRWPDLVEDMA